MKFRVIKADYKSKYDCYFNGHKKDIQYYIVQYKKDPSFFGFIKHDWQTAEFNIIQNNFDGSYIVQYKKDPSFLDLLNMIGKLPNIMLNNWLKALSVKNLLLAVPRYVITIKIF